MSDSERRFRNDPYRDRTISTKGGKQGTISFSQFMPEYKSQLVEQAREYPSPLSEEMIKFVGEGSLAELLASVKDIQELNSPEY